MKSGTKLQKHVKNQYKESARLALQQGFTQEAALACELAGNYQHRCGALDDAMVDWRRSCEFYKEWGAIAKENHLRDRMALVCRNSHEETNTNGNRI